MSLRPPPPDPCSTSPQNEGIVFGFYKGLAPSVVKSAVSSMLLFGLFDLMHVLLARDTA